MIQQCCIVINLILIYFYSVAPISLSYETHIVRLQCAHSPGEYARIPMMMLGYCGVTVWLCALYLTYEIAYHYSPLDMTMYTYVH